MVEYLPHSGKISTMKDRKITPMLIEALEDTPVVLLQGPRQSGKTTLVREGLEGHEDRRYLSFDDLSVAALATEDPQGFINGLEGNVTLDEVQQVPQIARAIKHAVDRDRRPGRFLLTGSARVLSMQPFHEALVGRMQTLTLWPFSRGEIDSGEDGLVDRLFREGTLSTSGSAIDRDGYLDMAVQGGFPEAAQRKDPGRRTAWFGSYLSTLVQRDLMTLADIEHLTVMPRVLRILAARSAGLLNTSAISRDVGMPNTTLSRYLALLEALFLITLVPAWTSNLGRRAVKSPKLLMTDSGILCHLLGIERTALEAIPTEAGRVLETFAGCELIRQLGWSRTRGTLHHFRTHTGMEVDFVIEDAAGRLVGIEVKASSTVGPSDLKGLRALRDSVPDRFLRGVILYTGSEGVPVGEGFHALPISDLWT